MLKTLINKHLFNPFFACFVVGIGSFYLYTLFNEVFIQESKYNTIEWIENVILSIIFLLYPFAWYKNYKSKNKI